jgi:predicted transcriptional regulator
MQRPDGDPFLAELKADVLDGLAEAARGELVPAVEVYRHVYEVIRNTSQEEP